MMTMSEFFSICVIQAASPIAARRFGVGASPRERAFHGSNGVSYAPHSPTKIIDGLTTLGLDPREIVHSRAR